MECDCRLWAADRPPSRTQRIHKLTAIPQFWPHRHKRRTRRAAGFFGTAQRWLQAFASSPLQKKLQMYVSRPIRKITPVPSRSQ